MTISSRRPDRPAPSCLSRAVFIGVLVALFQLSFLSAAWSAPEDFYTQRGADKTFAEIMESGGIKPGSNTTKGITGSLINVNGALLKDGPNARRKISQEINIHTLANSSIQRGDFPKWTRWYQEDGNTQVFRLFEGETNVRNSRELAARVEAFSRLGWKEGKWHEWVGTYTIIKPHGCAIFQSKNNENDWSVQLNMNDNGDVTLNHRRGQDKVIARNTTGKPFHIRVRDNGLDYEVFYNGKSVGTGSYARPKGETSFRWGMYLGANKVRHQAMIFVTGAGIDAKDVDESGLVEASESPPGKESAEVVDENVPEPEPAVPEGLAIPARKWTNKEGVVVSAPGVFNVGDDFVMLKVGSRWVSYSLADLSESDRAALLQAADFNEK